MHPAPQMIGVDIGGSGARASCVERDEKGRLCVGELHELEWDDDFEPIPLREQLSYPGEVTAAEEVSSGARVAHLADLILGCTDRSHLSCHISAPGLLTEDGSGILVWRNGPRRSTLIPDLERTMKAKRQDLECAVWPICPDSVACALGEQHTHGGALRGVSNALCIAGGSGIGEGMIVEGRCYGLNELDPPLSRAWELSGGEGASIEDHVAPARVLAAWRKAGGAGKPEAQEVAGAGALLDARDRGVLALIERSRAWFQERGLSLERVVLSQTLGRIYSEDNVRFKRLTEQLGELELAASTLREAPLAGAIMSSMEQRP